ncbi:MAG: tetratricopeptide repeat protein [Sulfuritalea sp.]|nr:tetratricopeptide repeat protein [Sulfuritalea sp.]
MSLLMDALKKAELAKRQGPGASGAAETQAQGGLALEPIADSAASEPATPPAADASAAAAPSPLPSKLEEIDAQFLADAQQAASLRLKAQVLPPPVAPPPAEQSVSGGAPPRTKPEPDVPQDRSSAQNLFAAKQADKPPARKSFALAIGALTVLSVCGIGGYFWWQLQPKTVAMVSRPPVPPPPVVAPAPAVPPVVALPPAVAAAPTPERRQWPPPGHRSTSAAAPATSKPADDSAPAAARTRRPRAVVHVPAPAAAEPDSPVRVTKAPLKVNPALLRGFDAFNRGDLELAQTEYERAQKSDPRNTDALHGLAAIALRQGRPEHAERLYRQIAEADPQDTVAMSALINSRAQIDPGAAESRLKTLSAAQPELAAPHFALGNLYAREGRWNDAQLAYFRAYSAEADNPDILYNLAISLEHLRQNKLAAQYYSQAIAAAQTRPAGFDKAQATARLQTLQP